MRDWHLRVFLKRIWRGEPLGVEVMGDRARPERVREGLLEPVRGRVLRRGASPTTSRSCSARCSRGACTLSGGRDQTAPVRGSRCGRIPYVGLTYYTEAYADVFFGRDVRADADHRQPARRAADDAVRTERRRQELAAARRGRGAAARARAAQHGRARHGRSSSRSCSAPGATSPVIELIARSRPRSRPFVRGPAVELPRTGLDAAIEAAATAVDATLLIVLDQFEEYFLYSARGDDAAVLRGRARPLHQPPGAAMPTSSSRCARTPTPASATCSAVTSPIRTATTTCLDYLDRAAAAEAITRPIDALQRAPPRPAAGRGGAGPDRGGTRPGSHRPGCVRAPGYRHGHECQRHQLDGGADRDTVSSSS